MRRKAPRRDRDSTIALINIVFLMLIFFLVAGTVAAPLGKDIELVKTSRTDDTTPSDALVIHADGQLTHRGAGIASAADFVASLEGAARDKVRIVPDRDLDAAALVRLGRALREAGAGGVVILAERTE